MEDTVAAREFLEFYLPQDFKDLVDLSNIIVEKESFVEDDLKKALSDVIYRIKTKDNEEAYAFVLIEHQSIPDYLIAFRLWKYMLLLCDRYIKKDKDIKQNREGSDEYDSNRYNRSSHESNNKLDKTVKNSAKPIKLPLVAPIVFYNGTKKYKCPF